jgi:3-deoxy-D-manno-octulosonic-acid transferase
MKLPVDTRTAIAVYDFLWRIILPTLGRNSRLASGFDQRRLLDEPDPAGVWIQSASVGEAYLTREILKDLTACRSVPLLLTVNTDQGHAILRQAVAETKARQPLTQASVRYFPFDRPTLMRQAVARIRPRLMVLLETELWPGLLAALQAQNTRTLLVNARLTPRSFARYRLLPRIWHRLRPDLILAVSYADARRFVRLFGSQSVAVMPNIKFDRVRFPASHQRAENPLRGLLPPGAPFVVFGSVRDAEAADVAAIMGVLRQAHPDAVFGLFPRHGHRIPTWEKRLESLGLQQARRSTLDRRVVPGTVILWDTFGELSQAYALGCGAFVGGSLAPLGGQNFLEALAHGVVPVVGPFWENFHWVGAEIVTAKLLQIARDWRHAAALLTGSLLRPRPREQVQAAAQTYMDKRRGGTAMAVRAIETLLGYRSAPTHTRPA